MGLNLPPPSDDTIAALGSPAPAVPAFTVAPPKDVRLPGGGYAPQAPLPGPMDQVNNEFSTPPPVVSDPTGAVPLQEDAGNSTASTDDFTQGAVQGQQLRDYVADLTPGGGGPKGMIRPAGEEFSGVGGERGKADYEQGLIKGPEELRAAERNLNAVEADRAKALGDFYDKQSAADIDSAAAMKAQRADDQIALAKRQNDLDRATQFYTNDLADQGKFWTNPGNIVSAIAFSLMPIFSNDPRIGADLINKAIDRDMANRQHAAQGTLGALQSNLAGYQKIVGDRQAGDTLAMAEAHRVAASEIMRIGQKFDSPVSKAKLEVLMKDQQNKDAVLRMEAYQKWGIRQEAKVVDPALFAARGQGYEGEWRKYGSNTDHLDPELKQSSGGAVNGTIDGTKSTAATSGKPLSAQDAAIFTSPKLTVQAVLGGRVPGGIGMADVLRRSIARQAAAVSGYVPGQDPKAFNKAKVDIVNQAEADMGEFSKQMSKTSGQRAAMTSLQRDMDIIQKSEGSPEAADKFIGHVRAIGAQGFMSWYENVKRSLASDPNNPAARREADKADAAMRFRSLFSDQMVDYYHTKAGAAQSDAEMANLHEVVKAGSSWSQIRAFVGVQSQKLDREAKEILAGAKNPLAAMIYMTRTGIGVGSSPTPLPSIGLPAAKRGAAAIPVMGALEAGKLGSMATKKPAGTGIQSIDDQLAQYLPMPKAEQPAPAAPDARPPNVNFRGGRK